MPWNRRDAAHFLPAVIAAPFAGFAETVQSICVLRRCHDRYARAARAAVGEARELRMRNAPAEVEMFVT